MCSRHSIFAVSLSLSFAAVAAGQDFERDRALARLFPGADLPGLLTDFGMTVVDSVPGRDLYLFDLPGEEDDEREFARDLARDPRVDWAEVNFFARDPDPGTQSFFLRVPEGDYAGQYAVAMLRLPDAHERATGSGILVALLDSGLDDTHPALAGSIAPGGYNFVNNNTDLSDAPDGLDSDGDGLFDEMVGHGTMVAGLTRLAAPGASILPIKVLDSDGLTTNFIVARGIDFAITANARIINVSLGSYGSNRIMTEAAAWSESAGVLLVAAVGNDARDDRVWHPAAVPTAFAIAATDGADVLALFSNRAPAVDLCAPGVAVVGAVPGGDYGRANGTSFGAPLVTGVAALILQRQPSFSPAQLRAAIENAAFNIDAQNPGLDGLIGRGRLDALAALGDPACPADFDGDGFVTGLDFDLYVVAFEAGDPSADFDQDGFITGIDFDLFVVRFEAGC